MLVLVYWLLLRSVSFSRSQQVSMVSFQVIVGLQIWIEWHMDILSKYKARSLAGANAVGTN